ncbi:MAG: carbamoyl-phosphate synthase small subunit [Alphaproteobacteria bacterium]|nr:carbamoyl-phosphate synthase small subunit [Alphaproteobacteria bacterium]
MTPAQKKATGGLAPPQGQKHAPAQPQGATGVLVLADGRLFWGQGFGAVRQAVGEVCFNTSMTGYQEILTDPSYCKQIITFTFPHIGNVGANAHDIESTIPFASGLLVRQPITEPANWRSQLPLQQWLVRHNLVGLAGIDTRALTAHIREVGAPKGVIAHAPDGKFDVDVLRAQAAEWPGLDGLDLAKEVTCAESYEWHEGVWQWQGDTSHYPHARKGAHKVVAIDYGAKRNILRCLASAGCDVVVVPASTSAEKILAMRPDGVFLSNGPGDPAATGAYAVPVIQELLKKQVPIFGICLGHQLLALAVGARTKKMHLGHRGANHPVKDLTTGKVEITSQNHGFMVLPDTLPHTAEVTHISLFDGSNEGLRLTNKPAFSVQYHPEASPGPHDSHYLFQRFVTMIEHHKKQAA